jgi:hypothetical protein
MIKNIAQKFKNSFEGICHQLLVQGYQLIRTNGSCDKNWDEENISAHFINNIENLPLAIKHKVEIEPEIRNYTNAHINQGKKAKTASRIDLYFFQTTWTTPKQVKRYSVEAKNISQNSWTKNTGKKVPTSNQKTEYITKGIDEFVQGNYLQGCMVGYVVQGNIPNIIGDVNSRIQKQANYPSTIDVISKVSPILGFTEVYESKCVTPSVPNGMLKHFFFDLT